MFLLYACFPKIGIQRAVFRAPESAGDGLECSGLSETSFAESVRNSAHAEYPSHSARLWTTDRSKPARTRSIDYSSVIHNLNWRSAL